MAWLVLAGAIGAGAVALALLARGVARERGRREAREMNEYVATRKRMDAVDSGGDPDNLRDWLRKRARQSGRDL